MLKRGLRVAFGVVNWGDTAPETSGRRTEIRRSDRRSDNTAREPAAAGTNTRDHESDPGFGSTHVGHRRNLASLRGNVLAAAQCRCLTTVATMTNPTFDGRVAVVTGASSGIGAATAKSLPLLDST